MGAKRHPEYVKTNLLGNLSLNLVSNFFVGIVMIGAISFAATFYPI